MTLLLYLEQPIKRYKANDDVIWPALDFLECPIKSCGKVYVSGEDKKCNEHKRELREVETWKVNADVQELEIALEKAYRLSQRNGQKVIFIYDHEGPATRFGSWQESQLMRQLFKKPVLVVDKETNCPPEADLEASPMRLPVESMGESFYQKRKIDAVKLIKETALNDQRLKRKIRRDDSIIGYFSISLRRGYMDADYQNALKAVEYIEDEAADIGLNLSFIVPNPTLESYNDGTCDLDDYLVKFFTEKLRPESKKYKIMKSGHVKIVDRDIGSMGISDFLWLNIPRVEDMYRTDDMKDSEVKDLRKKIKSNRAKYDPRISFNAVSAMAQARAYFPTIVITKKVDVSKRLMTHPINLESELYGINRTDVVFANFGESKGLTQMRREIKEIIEGTKHG